MKYVRKIITVRDLIEGYKEDTNGVTTMNGHLDIRPPYQRNFCYEKSQSQAVIRTLMEGSLIGYLQFGCQPENAQYIDMTPNNNKIFNTENLPNHSILEMGDGQQRTISLGRFIKEQFTYQFAEYDCKEEKYYSSFNTNQEERLLNAEIDINICIGTPEEQFENFKRINSNGERINEQEMRNAAYTGEWLMDAKVNFAANGFTGDKIFGTRTKEECNRQLWLEQMLSWIADRDGFNTEEHKDPISVYMSKHQKDKDASELSKYYNDIRIWVEKIFPSKLIELGLTAKIRDWGPNYNQYHTIYTTPFDTVEVDNLLADEEVEDKASIIRYLLSGDKNLLVKRKFSSGQKSEVWRRQDEKCAHCGVKIPASELSKCEAHHILAWEFGGKTINTNCAVLHKKCHDKVQYNGGTLTYAKLPTATH